MTDTQQGGASRTGTASRPAHPGHGNSPAAWTAVGVVMLGSLLMSVAVVASSVWLFVVGAVVVLLGAPVGRVLAGMGFGVSGRPGH